VLATVVRIVQVSLGALAAYLLYGAVAPLVGETSVPEAVIPDAPPLTEQAVDRERYAVISERNLFRTVEVAPEPEPEPPEETIEESSLRLTLVGTAVFGSPELSTAAVAPTGSGEVEVVRIGDDIDGATVERIERKRLVVRNRGKLEQISLDDQKSPGSGAKARAASSARERVERARERALSRRQSAQAASRSRANRRQPSQRQPRPSDESSAPQADAMEALGDLRIKDGESIVSINGIAADDLDRLLESGEPPWTVRITDKTGKEREVVLEEGP
jgi:hypothetical protein